MRFPLPEIVLALGLAATPALAQAPGPEATPDPQTTIPEQVAPPSEAIQGPSAGETLSEHLGDTGGVLHPRGNPDPGIAVPPPVTDPGTMPVIPPPGTPGGDPALRPQ